MFSIKAEIEVGCEAEAMFKTEDEESNLLLFDFDVLSGVVTDIDEKNDIYTIIGQSAAYIMGFSNSSDTIIKKVKNKEIISFTWGGVWISNDNFEGDFEIIH